MRADQGHDEWAVADRRYLSEESMAQLTPPAPTPLPAAAGTDPAPAGHANLDQLLTAAKTA